MDRKEAFLAGFHPRLGANSSIKKAADTGLFDSNLVSMIFQFDTQPSQVVIPVEPEELEEPKEPEERNGSLSLALLDVIFFTLVIVFCFLVIF